MKVLVKLNEARKQFHTKQLKKTGYNKFSDYYYFELRDFLIPALEIFEELKLSAVVSFGIELATMTLTDLEDGSQFQITSPMSTANLKACHAVQNLGAVETYIRRYLWVAALEIVEHDAIDSSAGADEKPVKKESSKPVAQAAWEAEDEESQKYLKGLADDVKGYLVSLDIESAVFKLEDAKLSADEKVAIWFLFDSKQRRSIKDYQDNQRAKEQ